MLLERLRCRAEAVHCVRIPLESPQVITGLTSWLALLRDGLADAWLGSLVGVAPRIEERDHSCVGRNGVILVLMISGSASRSVSSSLVSYSAVWMCVSLPWPRFMGETILAIGRPAWPFSHMPFRARLETPSWTGPRAEAAASAHELNRWPHGKSEMPRTRNWKHLLKVSLGCARRPGREPFHTGPAGGTAYTHRYKN